MQKKSEFILNDCSFKYKFLKASKSTNKIMIVLHGRGDSIKPFFNFNHELGLSEMNYLLLNAPRKFLTGYSWYGEPPFQKNGVLRIRAKIFDILNELQNLGFKSKDIFLFGFSQGCLVSTDVALNYPKKLGGLVGISGYFHFFPRWRDSLSKEALRTPWILTHGYKDDILPYADTKYGAEKLQSAGLDIEFISLNKKHDMIDEEYSIIKRWIKNKF